MRNARPAIFWLTCAVLAFAAAPLARAGTFEVKTPDLTKGQTEFSWNSNFQRGFPPNADTTTHSTEFDLGYTPLSWLFIGGKLNLDKPMDQGWLVSTAGVETQLRFGKARPGFDFGWYSSVDFRIADDQTNTFTFGPILQFGDDKTSLTLNPFFQQTFGVNRQDGIALAFAAMAKHEVKKDVSIGVEYYGTIPDIGHTSAAFQDHRIGPVLYLEREIGPAVDGREAPKAALTIGGYFGLTDGSPDFTGKVKLGFTW
jgi:hypothetical protein